MFKSLTCLEAPHNTIYAYCNTTATQDPLQTEVCSVCPKDILSRLTLPQGHDLDSLLSAGSESSATGPSMTTHGASLPPFTWSHSQAGFTDRALTLVNMGQVGVTPIGSG